MNIPNEPRMYVILREDLGFKYIQGSHALANFALDFPDIFRKWNNSYLICLSVFNGLALRGLRDNLVKHGVTLVQFIEPDLESNLPTALCLFDDGKNDYRSLLKNISLASK